jgi:HlyD family type I secretion membrane fusion protein
MSTETKSTARQKRFGIASRVMISGALAVALLAGAGGWAAQAKLSGAIITQGQIVVSQQVKTIQHLYGGIVADIPVRNGDAVRKGDILFRLDATETRVELAIVQNQLHQLLAMRGRLLAERDNGASIDFGADGISEAIIRSEENRASLLNQKEQLRLQIGQLEQQAKALEAQAEANEREAVIVEQEVKKSEKLLAAGLVQISHMRDLRRQLVRIEGTRGELAARVAEAGNEVSEVRMKLLSLDQTRRKEAQGEIVGIEAKVGELREREVAAKDKLARIDVKAPVDGLVYDLQIHTVGGIVASGATVMSIVPAGEDMNVEIRIPPVDIDRIQPGQDTRIRFTAFNQRTTPEFHGKVEVVAAATSTDRATGQPYYLATVTPADLLKLGERKLVPGMPVEVYVQTEERTVISYLTKPFMDQMMRAFREE